MRAPPLLAASLAAVAALAGCENQAPTVQYQGAALAQAPSQEMMAAYYCPQVVSDALGVGAAACGYAFGAPPAASAMTVGFDLSFKVHNPNAFPIPVAEILTAVTVFPGETEQALGASCVVFCSAGDASCTGQPGPDSCTARSGDIRSIEDFGGAAAGLLLASGASLAAGEAPSFTMPEVIANGDAVVNARFAFGTDPLLAALEQLALQSASELAAGQQVSFAIPYRIEGTIWLDVGSLGRVALGYGPVEGTWTLPAEQLVPSF
jgi:hypothetical protein